MALPQHKLDEFSRIIEECGDDPELHKDRLHSAHSELLNLKSAYRSSPELYDLLGRIACLLQLEDDCLTYHRAAIQINSSSWLFRFDFGVSCSKLGKLDEAIDSYLSSLECNPTPQDSALTWAYLASAYYRANKPEAAIDASGNALKSPLSTQNAIYIIDRVLLKMVRPRRMNAKALFVLGSLDYYSLALKKSLKLSPEKSHIILRHTKDYLSLVRDKVKLAFESRIDFKDVDQNDLRESFEEFQRVCQDLNVLPIFDEEFDFGVAYDIPASN